MVRNRHESALKLKFVMNFGCFVVRKLKFMAGQPTQTFNELSKQFVKVPAGL